MHVEAYDFAFRASKITGPVDRALEVGARDLNGSGRDCWPACHWTGIDLTPGSGVDIVADVTQGIDGSWPLVLCTEMLEHCAGVEAAVQSMVDASSEWIVITCATDPRAPHSGIDGGQVRASEWYRNVDPDELAHPRLETVLSEVHADRGDLYFLGRVRRSN